MTASVAPTEPADTRVSAVLVMEDLSLWWVDVFTAFHMCVQWFLT